MSVGMRKRSSKKGIATDTSPKKLRTPTERKAGYSLKKTGVSANHPANKIKLRVRSFPQVGNVYEIGTITPTAERASSVRRSYFSKISLLFSANIGRTINRFPVAKAVMSTSLVDPTTSRYVSGVKLITNPGKIQNANKAHRTKYVSR